MNSIRRAGVTRFLMVLILSTLVSACAKPVVEDGPASSPAETLTAVGKRLGRIRSINDLTEIASRGENLLAVLEPAERSALARGHIQFEVDQPARVYVAVRAERLPYWLKDRGFVQAAETVEIQDQAWALYAKTFPAGLVELGVNALDRLSPEHYSVFVQPAKGRGPIQIEVERPERYHLVSAGRDVSTALDAKLPLGDLPACLAGSTLLQVPRELRHATSLATGRIWKTHVVSSPRPDQVTLAFGADPVTQLSWSWRTDPSVEASVVRLRRLDTQVPNTPRSETGENLVTRRGTVEVVHSPNLLNDPLIHRHHVRVSDLEPGTSYAYSVGDGTDQGSTPWQTVRTAAKEPTSTQFLYMGDAQCGFEGWGKLLQAARTRHPDAAFLILAGDLVDRGNERTNWDHFFLRAKPVFDQLPLMPCVGNHEYLDQGPRLYRSTFSLPRNGPKGIDSNLVYSFENGDAFFAVLDSNLALADRSLAQLQARWLDDALARTRATWKFVVFHHPIYASHPSRLNPTLGEDWIPVFDKHHVDLVLQGHDHAYLRTYPYRQGRRVASNAEGTTYVVSVSGEKFCDQNPRDYTEAGLTHISLYQTIDIDIAKRQLLYRAWDLEGRERDRLEIQKPTSGTLALDLLNAP